MQFSQRSGNTNIFAQLWTTIVSVYLLLAVPLFGYRGEWVVYISNWFVSFQLNYDASYGATTKQEQYEWKVTSRKMGFPRFAATNHTVISKGRGRNQPC